VSPFAPRKCEFFREAKDDDLTGIYRMMNSNNFGMYLCGTMRHGAAVSGKRGLSQQLVVNSDANRILNPWRLILPTGSGDFRRISQSASRCRLRMNGAGCSCTPQGLVIGHWSLVIGHWSLVIGHWSLVIGH
jgi:hypothetical protein